MAHFLAGWTSSSDSIAALRASPHDRLAMSTRLAEAFQGSIVSYYNRTGEYDGLGIFLFPDLVHAAAHTVHAMATGAFESHRCEPLLTSTE